MKTQYAGHPDQRWGHITYAQHGDDIMLLNIFEQLGVPFSEVRYIDIGAHHPTTLSNTKLLYDRGACGVNVEANPNLIEAFMDERPRDINMNVGVGVEAGDATFYMYSTTSGRNTFSEREVESLKGVMAPGTRVQLPMVTLDSIVENISHRSTARKSNDPAKNGWPHLLSMDIEGLDYDVLASSSLNARSWVPQGSVDALHRAAVDANDPMYRASGPLVICVEVRPEDTIRVMSMLAHKGYFSYCRMGENMFFIQMRLKSWISLNAEPAWPL